MWHNKMMELTKLLSGERLFQIASLISFCIFCGLFLGGESSQLAMILAAIVLAFSISLSIHHASSLSKIVGPSWGTLILAIAVTVIEVGLIIAMMSKEGEGPSEVARNTVFSAVMIVTNGIVGLSLVLGTLKFRELEFRVEGTSSLLAVLVCLVGITLMLPNYTISVAGPYYSVPQLIFASIASIIIYIALVFAQTVTHKDYFGDGHDPHSISDDAPITKWSMTRTCGALFLSLVTVIGLAKLLSPVIEKTLVSFGAPPAALGIVIALLVLMPEAGAAFSSAREKQLQTSLNLALGSGAASVALTIPVICVFSVMTGKQVSLGLPPKDIAFTILTFVTSGLTLGTGKGTALKGIVHLTILLAYIILTFSP